ncbi:related to E3 ubiquitin-protein ligase hrd-1 precursor [Rhynchosporium agropyri]|uniref:RING-type E3 ubiquitin transferase n=1 Tax=Rhynchosporium agropyri TaxID=914238 RepID=A0A1E1JWZ8_9HELO|nr:related to E3 ubiquitin-protein ligase hrd-1 precursor [Rhynchosporium agropyri]
MGRLVWYAGASTALAGGVVLSALNQRANFYSACVYISQNNLCLFILINLIGLVYGSFMYGLQRLCYGPLRPIETEQLYEKSWFAITETCLAMTIFREEVGAWFLVMFTALLTGKVWGWIGDGRVEILEQQPPANPRLFHYRLSISLGMSVIYDLLLMRYTINTVIQQARPNMMVMFLFEFAVLTTTSIATALRYVISRIEERVTKQQTQERLIERRREVRESRAEMIQQREATTAAAVQAGQVPQEPTEPLPEEDDVDEMDIEIPGWEAKGHWVLTLDLITDFFKLGIYVSFFVILLMFYGLPIHIMRDLFLTARSFFKRLSTFVKYRQATQDMNARYEDATVEDIEREDTCIICREEMRPWSVTNPVVPPAAPGQAPPARPATTVNERTRPKKLPCGHILHLGCLKSWLERQQVCPTCRRPVIDVPGAQPAHGVANNGNAAGQGAQPAPGQQDGAGAQPPGLGRPQRRMRMLNFGPLRVGFGQANLQDFAQGLAGQQQGQQNGAPGAGNARIYGLELGFPRRAQQQAQAGINTNAAGAGTIQDQLQHLEQQTMAEIRSLQVTQQELHLVQLLQVELARLRLLQNGLPDPLAAGFQVPLAPQLPQVQLPQGPLGIGRIGAPVATPQMSRHVGRTSTAAIPSGSAELPPGVTIPEGWSLLPLERLEGAAAIPEATSMANPGPSASAGLAPTATTQGDFSHMAGDSNNTLTPTPTQNPDGPSQASSVDSSDTNAVHTPLSVAADQSSNTDPNTTLTQRTAASSKTGESVVSAQEESGVDLDAEASALPNWGSSQLFTGSNSLAKPSNTSESSSRPSVAQSMPTITAIDQASSNTVPSIAGGGSYISQGTDGAEEETISKGKAKAATVEDTADEAEGA